MAGPLRKNNFFINLEREKIPNKMWPLSFYEALKYPQKMCPLSSRRRGGG